MFVGSVSLGCNANPLTGHILASFSPCIVGQKKMQKRQFETIFTPKLHRTASCRHAGKGVARARSVYQCLQKGGKGGIHITRVPRTILNRMGQDMKKHCQRAKF